MSNLLAAVGRGQLENLDKKVNAKRKIFSNYRMLLSKIEGVSFLADQPDCKSNKWLTTMILDKNKSIILTFIFDRTDVYDISTFEG